jgi:mannose-6-phosphate isomerase-like protein (cupin superfamily)
MLYTVGTGLDTVREVIMAFESINLAEKLTLFRGLWSPKIVAQVNDHHVKVVKLQGDFVWHKHETTDELFLVLEGKMTIDFRDGSVVLEQGEMVVVPRGVEHKPCAKEECHTLVIERIATVNTGAAGGEMTAASDVWI